MPDQHEDRPNLWRRFVRDLRWLLPTCVVLSLAIAIAWSWADHSAARFLPRFGTLLAGTLYLVPVVWWRTLSNRELATRQGLLAVLVSVLWLAAGAAISLYVYR